MRATDFIAESAALATQLYAPHPNTVNESLGLKPQVKTWTSTAIKTPEGITSEWVRWCDAEMPEWIGDTGFLLDVAPAAKILTIRSDRDAVAVAQQYGAQFKNPIELMTKMPWAAIGQDYDAVHYTAENNWRDTIMRAWDVESTAWFNPGMLGNKRAVQLARDSDYLEEMAGKMRAQEFLTEAHHSRLATHKAGRYTVHIDSHFLATTAARNIPLRFISRFINYTFIMIPEIETIPRGKGAYVQDTNSLISIYIRRSNSYPLEFTVETVLSPDMKPTPPFFRRSFPFTPNEYKTDPRTVKAQTKMAKDVEQRGRDAVSQDLEDMPFKPQLINRQQRRALAKQARRK